MQPRSLPNKNKFSTLSDDTQKQIKLFIVRRYSHTFLSLPHMKISVKKEVFLWQQQLCLCRMHGH